MEEKTKKEIERESKQDRRLRCFGCLATLLLIVCFFGGLVFAIEKLIEALS